METECHVMTIGIKSLSQEMPRTGSSCQKAGRGRGASSHSASGESTTPWCLDFRTVASRTVKGNNSGGGHRLWLFAPGSPRKQTELLFPLVVFVTGGLTVQNAPLSHLALMSLSTEGLEMLLANGWRLPLMQRRLRWFYYRLH